MLLLPCGLVLELTVPERLRVLSGLCLVKVIVIGCGRSSSLLICHLKKRVKSPKRPDWGRDGYRNWNFPWLKIDIGETWVIFAS